MEDSGFSTRQADAPCADLDGGRFDPRRLTEAQFEWVREEAGKLAERVKLRQRDGIVDHKAEIIAPIGLLVKLLDDASAGRDLLIASRAFIAAEDALLDKLRAQGRHPDLTGKPWSLVEAMRVAVAEMTGDAPHTPPDEAQRLTTKTPPKDTPND